MSCSSFFVITAVVHERNTRSGTAVVDFRSGTREQASRNGGVLRASIGPNPAFWRDGPRGTTAHSHTISSLDLFFLYFLYFRAMEAIFFCFILWQPPSVEIERGGGWEWNFVEIGATYRPGLFYSNSAAPVLFGQATLCGESVVTQHGVSCILCCI